MAQLRKTFKLRLLNKVLSTTQPLHLTLELLHCHQGKMVMTAEIEPAPPN